VETNIYRKCCTLLNCSCLFRLQRDLFQEIRRDAIGIHLKIMTHHAYQSRGFSRILCGHMNLSGVILLLLSQTCMVKAFSNHNPELSIHAGSTLRPISRTKPASGIPKRRRSDILLMPHHHAAMGSPLFRQGRRTTAASSRLFRRHPVSSTGRGGLFRSLLQRWGIRKPTTSLDMVLTTPESVFEQASTEILLDDLIDESVRTSARKPIMMQFDPSSGYVSRLHYFLCPCTRQKTYSEQGKTSHFLSFGLI
jgi:hypothetical protein